MNYLTPLEIGSKLKVPEEKVIKWIEEGLLEGIKIEGIYRVRETAYDEFINSQNRHQPSTDEIVLMRQKTNAYHLLVEWLMVEIQMISEIYRDVEHVLEHTVDYLKGNLDNHRKAGDHHNERYVGNYLLQVFDHWEKPRRTYQDWLHKYEDRWYQFQDKYPPDFNDNLDLYYHQTEWPQFYQHNNLMGKYLMRGSHPVINKNLYYKKKYLWLKKELDELCQHYHKINKTIKKIIRKLVNERKKCSKEMDFKKGYLLHEIITMLYISLEKPRKKYNYWLMGKDERWQEFKSRNISRLREINESSESDVFNSPPKINSIYKEDRIDSDTFKNDNEYSMSLKREDNLGYHDELDEDEF